MANSGMRGMRLRLRQEIDQAVAEGLRQAPGGGRGWRGAGRRRRTAAPVGRAPVGVTGGLAVGAVSGMAVNVERLMMLIFPWGT